MAQRQGDMAGEEQKSARRSDAAGGSGTGSGRPRGERTGGTGRPTGGQQRNENQGRNPGRQVWQFVAYVVVALIALYLFQQFLLGPMGGPSTELDYGTFKARVAEGQVLTAVIGDTEITGTLRNPNTSSSAPLEFRT